MKKTIIVLGLILLGFLLIYFFNWGLRSLIQTFVLIGIVYFLVWKGLIEKSQVNENKSTPAEPLKATRTEMSEPTHSQSETTSNSSTNEELALRDGGAVYLKSLLNINQGTAYLTTKRFLFGKRSGLFNALAGPLLMHLKKGGNIVFEIEFTNIKSIVKGKHGIGSKYIFTNLSGQEYAVQFNKGKTGQDGWLNSICRAAENSGNNIKANRVEDRIDFKVVKPVEVPVEKLKSQDAMTKLKAAKEKLDLELITQSQYDALKKELAPLIV